MAEGVATPLIALGGDVIVAPTADGDPAALRVLKFDRALGSGEALPLELIAARITPERDAVEPRVHALSENARLLAGTTLDVAGVTRAWVLALHDSCDGQ